MPARIDPEIAVAEMRAAGVEPLEPYPGAKAPWRSECKTCGREVTPRLGQVRSGAVTGGCRFCSYRRFGDSIKLDSEDAIAELRAAGVEPLEPYPGTNFRWRSRCLTCNNEITPLFANVRAGHAACVFCAGKRSTSESAIADIRAAGVEPLEPYPGTRKPWRCQCNTCGNEVMPRLNGIRNGIGACRFCGSARGGEAIRVDPEIAVSEMRAAGVEPLEPYAGTKTPWLCRCNECGSESTPSLGAIRSGGGACRLCGIERRAESLRVAPEDAVDEMRVAGVEPLEPYSGNGKTPWLCRCLTCGEEGRPRLSTVRLGHGACFRCGIAKSAEALRVDVDVAVAEMRAAGLEPLEAPPDSTHDAWRCRCLACESEVAPRLHSIRGGQGGCKYCSPGGFNKDLAGSVYLFRHDEHRALKVGITNDKFGRLMDHESRGWHLVEVWSFDNGADAQVIERAVLKEWKDHPYAVESDDMPQSGYTETVSLDDVTEAEAIALVESEVALLSDPSAS